MPDEKIFTADYAYGAQGDFRQALNEGNYEGAYRVLTLIPRGQTEWDKAQRKTLMIEGLNALVCEMLDGGPRSEAAQLAEEQQRVISSLDDSPI